ncbi:MAG: T9SS type A sorting domain-containing protein [Bacteroidota bacterium]
MKTLLILLAIFLSAHAFAQEPVWSKKYHTGSVTCLDFSGDGGKLLSGGKDSTIKLWEIVSADTLKGYRDIRAQVNSVDFSSTSNWFLAGSLDYNTRYYTPKLVLIGNLTTDTTYEAIKEEFIVYFEPKLNFEIRQVRDKKITQSYLINDKTFINFIGGRIFNLTRDGKEAWDEGTLVAFYNLDSLKRIETYKNGYLLPIEKVIASSSRKRFFVPYIGVLNVNIDLGSYFTQIKNLNNIGAFSPDDSTIVIVNKNDEINIFSITGNEISRVSSKTSSTTALAIDNFNRYYISAHADSTLRLWTPGIPNIFKRILLKSPVTTIAVSPDSVHFATAHTDGTVALWNIDSLAYYSKTDSVPATDIREENPFKNTTLSVEPNPFKNSTTIRFSLPNSLKIKLTVTDILGREVAVLKDELMETGEQNVVFKNGNLPKGMYYITLSGDGLLKTIPVQIAR